MTIDELLIMPKGISLQQYQLLLNRKKILFAKCQRLSDKIEDEKDSLNVLKDEENSDRFLNHKKMFEKYSKQQAVHLQEYKQIEKQLTRGK
jgi:rubrerythrin